MMGGGKMPWIIQVEKVPNSNQQTSEQKKAASEDASIADPAALQWCQDVGLLTAPE